MVLFGLRYVELGTLTFRWVITSSEGTIEFGLIWLPADNIDWRLRICPFNFHLSNESLSSSNIKAILWTAFGMTHTYVISGWGTSISAEVRIVVRSFSAVRCCRRRCRRAPGNQGRDDRLRMLLVAILRLLATWWHLRGLQCLHSQCKSRTFLPGLTRCSYSLIHKKILCLLL